MIHKITRIETEPPEFHFSQAYKEPLQPGCVIDSLSRIKHMVWKKEVLFLRGVVRDLHIWQVNKSVTG